MGVKLGNGKWAIKEDKLLAYNDNSGRFFNKEFDFSRGSSATYVAKDGLIKTAGLQETNLVNNGDFSELGSELILNGGFDSDSDWLVFGNSEISNGKANLNSGTGSFTGTLKQNSVVTNLKNYKISFSISNYQEGVAIVSIGFNTSISVNANGDYTFYGISQSGDNTNFLVRNGASNFVGSIDNVSVKQVDPNDYWTLGTGWSFGDGVAICDGTDGVNLSQNGVIENGKTYKIKLDVNLTSGILLLRVGLSYSTDLTINESGSYQIIVVSDGTNFILRSGVFNGSVTNISVQEIQTDTPRIDFSDSVKGALLLEPSSTQLLQYSEDLSQTNKVINNGTNTVTSNYAISPDGTNTADRLVAYSESGSSNFSLRGILHSTSVAESYTHSVWLKSNTGLNQNVIFYGRNVQGSQALCEVTNEWKRFDFTGSSNTSNYFAYLGTRPEYGSDNNIDILVWGMQLEAKSFVTSYIPNHGVSGGVTRLADVCNNSGSAQDFSEEGVLYAEIAALTNEGNNEYISISDGTNDERLVLSYVNNNNIRVFVRSGGSFYATNNINLSNALDYNKIAFKYKSGNNIIYLNGNKVNTDTDTYSLGAFNVLNFSTGDALSNYFYGKVRELQVFTEALTDEQLEKLTTI
jgi:hypothetical protein